MILYIKESTPFYATLFVAKVRKNIDIIKDYPASGRIVPEYKNKFIRELFVWNYRLVYKILNKNTLIVLTIAHQKQNLN